MQQADIKRVAPFGGYQNVDKQTRAIVSLRGWDLEGG